MAYDYNKLITNTVIPSLANYGVATTLTRDATNDVWVKSIDVISGKQIYTNSETGEIVDEQEECLLTYNVTVLQDTIKKSEIDGKTVMYGDKILYMSPTMKPKIGDLIQLTQQYRVYMIEPISPADTIVLYKMYVRK